MTDMADRRRTRTERNADHIELDVAVMQPVSAEVVKAARFNRRCLAALTASRGAPDVSTRRVFTSTNTTARLFEGDEVDLAERAPVVAFDDGVASGA